MFSERDTIRQVPGLSKSRLQICIREGWVSAATGEQGLSFAEIDVARLQLICTLQDDIGVDTDLLPTLLSLLDQVYGLRQDLRDVMRAVDAQPSDVRAQILLHVNEQL
ncbi:MAG: hypothetical protein GY945_10205 [Rhodobacteraceae bacterium]|nr:hypothetical protein [Paracoccaceae bacterium]